MVYKTGYRQSLRNEVLAYLRGVPVIPDRAERPSDSQPFRKADEVVLLCRKY